MSAFCLIGLCMLPSAHAFTLGEAKFHADCAPCHGATGKGDGPFAKKAGIHAPTLTMLRKNNNGVFPFDRVYAIIDGRQQTHKYAGRVMPIWGKRYGAKSFVIHESHMARWYAESIIHTRIMAIIEHLISLQE